MALPGRYDPWWELKKMRKEMDDLFEGFFERGRERGEITVRGLRAPLSDLEDQGDSFVLKAELPGLNKEDIRIEVDKHSIVVSAERKGEKEEKKKSFYYCERTYSGYRRAFGLPEDIDPDSVQAEYNNGVLQVSMNKVKKTEEKKKKVQVN